MNTLITLGQFGIFAGRVVRSSFTHKLPVATKFLIRGVT